MKFYRGAIIGLLLLIPLWLVIGGCTQRLHPLLVEHNGNKPLTAEEVDIRFHNVGYLETQWRCMNRAWPVQSILGAGAVGGCALLKCARHKMWETQKPCTCEGWYWLDSVVEHEIKHCYGYIH